MLALALFAIVFAFLVTTASAEAGQPGERSLADTTRQAFPVKLVPLRAANDVPGVGQPGSWFDRRTEGLLKRWWHHSWRIYPATVGTGWGLALRVDF